MLDTNIVSALIRNPAGRAAERIRPVAADVSVSIIVAAELRYGAAKKGSPRLSRRVEEILSELPILPFEVPCEREYGSLRAMLEAAGQPIGSNDLLIAAHALTLGLTLVTANVGEFQRVPRLVVENWLE